MKERFLVAGLSNSSSSGQARGAYQSAASPRSSRADRDEPLVLQSQTEAEVGKSAFCRTVSIWSSAWRVADTALAMHSLLILA